MRSKKIKKLYNVEFLRFIFASIIVCYHILHNNIIRVTGENAKYLELASETSYGGAIVECFLIISGYFLFKSFYKNPRLTVKEFAYSKFLRLWPVLFVSLFIGLLFFNFPKYPTFFNLLFLQCIGVSLDYQGVLWYISPYFWVMIFYFTLLKYSKNKNILNIVIGIITYFSYVIIINRYAPIFGRDTLYGVFNLGLLRVLGGIGLGYLIAVCIENVKNMPSVKNFNPNKFQSFLIFLVMTVLETGSFALLMIHFFAKEKTYDNQFIVVILFTLLFVCLINGKGLLSRICNNRFFGFFGKFAYSIYVMQQISFYILEKTLWKNTDFVFNHALRCLAVSTLFSIAFGVVTYYVIELPSSVLLKKLGKKLFANTAKKAAAK